MTEGAAIRPHDPILFGLVCEAVKATITAIRAMPKGTYIPEYYGWGKVAWFASGLPHMERFFLGASPPKDYHQIVGDGPRFLSTYSYPVQLSTIPAFKGVESHILSQDHLRKYEVEDTTYPTDDPDWHAKWQAKRLVVDIVDRWMHLEGDTTPADDSVLPLYLPLELPYFERKLPIHIIVPLVCLKFEFESIRDADGTALVKMRDSFQLARMVTMGEVAGIHPVVANAATHALVLPDWELPNDSRALCQQTYTSSDAYPKDVIDTFLAALRAVTGYATGYAHLLMRPKGWAMSYQADIPSVVGTTVREYPPFFDKGYWLNEIPTVSEHQARSILKLFHQLRTRSTSNLAVASRRLNDCFLRGREDDAVTDAFIGLESLLTDGQGEITHKLSLRVAALYREFENTTNAVEVMKTVKGLYAYRSKIVHGKTKEAEKEAEKLRTSGVGAGASPRDTAIRFLRFLIKSLAEHPEYLSPTRIDEELLLHRIPEERAAGSTNPDDPNSSSIR